MPPGRVRFLEAAVTGYLIVFLGAGIGGALRHGFNLLAARLFGTGFPWGTLGVNVLGCLAMGLLAGALAARSGDSQQLRLFLATGVLGGFTTFSSYALDIVVLGERGAAMQAGAYLVASVVLGVAGLWVGLALMRGA